MPIADTSPFAEAVQLRVQRSMSDEQRLLLALEMSVFARELSLTRIRCEHPEWPDTRIIREIVREIFLPDQAPKLLR